MISILVAIAVVGFLCWLILQIPAPPIFKNVMMGVMILCLVLWLLSAFGLVGEHAFGGRLRF